MCGIAGIVMIGVASGQGPLKRTLVQMIDSMEHRGPDSKGFVEFEGVALGACRLSILGLELASNQPLSSPDSECTVIFNGEIYNYVELREELRLLGHRFISTGDTEVVVHAYEQWGTNCVSRLNGMFAFAVFDKSAGRLFLARDRFGVKPLYYSLADSVFLFASEPRALLRTRLITPAMDPEVVVDYLKFGVTDTGDRTFFRGISQVPPGYFCTIDRSLPVFEKWYDISEAHAQLDVSSSQSVRLGQFRSTLEDSVAIRMRSDVPFGILLSGGLDSSAIAAVSSRLCDPSTLKALTISFPGSPKDESSYAKHVAQGCRIPIQIESAGTVDAESIRRCIVAQQEPVISASVVAQWLVMEAAHKVGLKVLLSGQGADEYLGGYEYFDGYAVLGALRRSRIRFIYRHSLDPRNRQRVPRILRDAIFLLLPARMKVLRWRKPWLREGSHKASKCDYFAEFSACRNLEQALFFHVKRRLPELLRYEDRNSMAFSIETRHPFLDFRLVEISLNAPAEQIVGEGVRKWMLRRSVGDMLDSEVLARRDKIGFEPPASWLESRGFRADCERLLDHAPEEIRKMIIVGRAKRLLQRRGKTQARNDLWRIYNLLVWWSEFVSS